jgi:hypothetical protein
MESIILPPIGAAVEPPPTKLISFCHPGYEFPANVIFQLCAIELDTSAQADTTARRLGVHHETARIACAILANSAWEGYFTADRPDGPSIPLQDPDRILTDDCYYFHHPSYPAADPNSDARYPIVSNFESWKFPTSVPGQLPSYWRSLQIPSRPSQIHGFPSEPCCAVTGRHILLDSAHLIPVSETRWFERNVMKVFQPRQGQDNINWINQPYNRLRLTREVHHLLDLGHIVFVPRLCRNDRTDRVTTYSSTQSPTHETPTVALVCYVLKPDDPFHETVQSYHLRSLEPLAGIPAEYIFANFAHAVFHICEFFAKDGRQRRYIQLKEGGLGLHYEVRDDQGHADSGKLSRSPTKRRGTSQSSPEKRARSSNDDGLDANDCSSSGDETGDNGSGSGSGRYGDEDAYEDELPRGRTLKRRRPPGLTRSPYSPDLIPYGVSWAITEKPFPVIVDDRNGGDEVGRHSSDCQQHVADTPLRKRVRGSD